MFFKQNEKQAKNLLAFGIFVISVALATQGITDPVNTPKLLFLGIFSFSILGLLIVSSSKSWKSPHVITVIVFVACMLITLFRSLSPFSQNMYGTYGRNNGFLTYFCLSILLVAASSLTTRASHTSLLKALMYAGYVNLAYCLWVILYGDFMPWNNTYGNILGTFGNPNFIGAFLGIFFGVLLALVFDSETDKRYKWLQVLLMSLTIFEIYKTRAIQGRVLISLSVAVILFFYLRAKFGKAILWLYSTIIFCIGVVALAGAFQQGPLSEVIYKTSVSLRGQYWLAAWNTGQANPMSGVGMDAFGDWYRRARDLRAIELPGINTVVNTAHNVPLDMFAFGGWPLFICYLTLMTLALRSVFRVALRMQGYDSVGVALITAWLCYQAQSIISINQIGLAIWGWVLSGSVIGYDKLHAQNVRINQTPPIPVFKKVVKPQGVDGKAILYGSTFGLLGFFLVLPPLVADVSLRSAQVSREAAKLESTMNASYFNPLNTQKFIVNIQAFEESGLYALSHKYALEGVKWNPQSFELWRLLYLTKNATSQEKYKAVIEMKKLDPLNPDVTATQ